MAFQLRRAGKKPIAPLSAGASVLYRGKHSATMVSLVTVQTPGGVVRMADIKWPDGRVVRVHKTLLKAGV